MLERPVYFRIAAAHYAEISDQMRSGLRTGLGHSRLSEPAAIPAMSAMLPKRKANSAWTLLPAVFAMRPAKARGVALVIPRLHEARKNAVEAVKTVADRYAANVLPIIREAQKAGARTLRGQRHRAGRNR